MNDRCMVCGDHTDNGSVCRPCLQDATVIEMVESEPLRELLPEAEFQQTNRKARRARAAMRRKW